MQVEVILAICVIVGALLTAGATILRKHPITWLVVTVCVNAIEYICKWMNLNGYGNEKYQFVYGVVSLLQGTYDTSSDNTSFLQKILLKISPKLTDEEINRIIETVVANMHVLQEKQKEVK